jgi:hypothetical protein
MAVNANVLLREFGIVPLQRREAWLQAAPSIGQKVLDHNGEKR